LQSNHADNRGLIAAVCATFFIALSIIVIQQAGKNTPPLVVAAVGSLLSVPMLLAYHLLCRSNLSFGLLFTQCRKPFLHVLVSRTILGQALIVAGFAMTTAVKAVLLLRLEPLFVLLWAVLARQERLEWRKLTLLIILLVGTSLVIAPNSVSAPNVGDALIVLSLFFLSYSYGPTGVVVKTAGAPALNVMLSLIGGAVLAVVAFTVHGLPAFMLDNQSLGLIALYALIFFVIGCSLYFFAFNTVKPWLIASILSLEVVFGVGLAMILLHESVTILQMVGCLVVIAATTAIAALNRGSASVARQTAALNSRQQETLVAPQA
jgi:drug/metabolite transporter (DMT)-like permease